MSLDLLINIDASGMSSALQKYANIKYKKKYPFGALWTTCQNNNELFQGDILQQYYYQSKIMIGIMPTGKSLENLEEIAFFGACQIILINNGKTHL